MQVTTTEAREHFSEFINQVAYGTERITLTRRGQNVAAIVSASDLEFLEMMKDVYDAGAMNIAKEHTKKNNPTSLQWFKEGSKKTSNIKNTPTAHNHKSGIESFFGLWKDRDIDGVEYQNKLRSEWDR